MIHKDNIKDDAIAAFRAYGHGMRDSEDPAIEAVERTMLHLSIDDDTVALEGMRAVYFVLPLGVLKRGTISRAIVSASEEMHVDERRLYRKLARCRAMYHRYYKSLLTKKCQ